MRVFREVRRVLRDDGTVWVNYGDAYDSATRANRKPSENVNTKHGYWTEPSIVHRTQARPGSWLHLSIPPARRVCEKGGVRRP